MTNITINEKEYDVDDFDKNQRKLLKTINDTNAMLQQEQFKINLMTSTRDNLVKALEASLEEPKDEEGTDE